ncbi:MAG TPA: zf-HC2 domain-containing protein, partial [Gemmatimonadaceae bacterium]|nr:zf-HC2 domain-containing protein [Gemmatimonadaceae bacterium]
MSHVDDGTLHALVDDQLEPRERATVEAHLAACGECARRFAEAMAMARQVTTLLGALDEMPVRVTVAPPAPHVEATTSDVARATEVTPIRSRLLTMRRVAIAASVLLVASVSYEVGRRGDAPVATAPAAITADAATEAMSATPSTPSTPAAQVTADTARLGSAAPLATTTPQAAMRAQESRGDFAGAGAAADRAIAASVASVAATPAAQQLAQNAVVVPAPSGAPASMKVDAAIDQRTVGSQVAAVAAPVEQAARRETLLERAARNPPQLNA